MKKYFFLSTFIFIFIASPLFAQFDFAKEKVIIGSKKKNPVGILYTMNDGTFVFQYGDLGEEGFINGKGISVFFKYEPSKTKLSEAILGFDLWKYEDEYFEGDFQNGIKFGKGKVKDKRRYYEGDFENDLPHGLGIVKKFDSKKIVYQYSGYFFKGFPHGPGELMEHGNLGVAVAHFPDEYFTGMIIAGKPKGLILHQKEGGKDKLIKKKNSEFEYRTSHYSNARNLVDYINGDTALFLNLFDHKKTVQINKDTLFNGALDENKKPTGFCYIIDSKGTVQCGNFNNGLLNGYGLTYSVSEAPYKLNKNDYSKFTYTAFNGLFKDGILLQGSKSIIENQVRQTATSFMDYGGNVSELLDLELKTKLLSETEYFGTYNENEKLDGPGCSYSAFGTKMKGTFKDGKLHGNGYLKNNVGEFTGRFEEGEFKDGKISYNVNGPMGPPDNAILMVNGLPGIYCKSTGKTLDGRTINEWDYYNGDVRDFFHYCSVCYGAGILWEKCYSTYKQYTHLEEKSKRVTYGSRTFIKSWSEPQYKNVVVTSECSKTCSNCNGQGRSPKSLEEIKVIFNKK